MASTTSIEGTLPTVTAGAGSMRVELPRLEQGSRVGRYQIVGELGAGGMGVVYQAYDPELDRLVALKLLVVMAESEQDRERARARVVREAQALAQLSHPNVVSVFDVGTYEDGVFIAMELVRGKSLRQWLESGRSWREVLAVFRAAGQGLAAAHDAGLVHRDFKPSNLIVGDDGRPRVLDFGLARTSEPEAGAEAVDLPKLAAFAADRSASDSDSSHGGSLLGAELTIAGSVLGTPAYMSPEQHLGQQVDARADQFSFCVALYEALYGSRPFGGESFESLRERVVLGKVSPAPRDAAVPTWVRKVLLRGLAPQQDARFPGIRDLLAALDRDPQRVRRRALEVGGVIALAGLAVYGFARDGDDGERACRGGSAAIEKVWAPATRAAVAASFEATGLAHASEAAQRVLSGMDGYAKTWEQAYGAACTATRVHGHQSEALLDLRMRCLDRRRDALGGLADALSAELGRDDVAQATTALAELPRISDCAEVDTLASGPPLPADPKAREAVARDELELARLRAALELGRFRSALEPAQQLAARAQGLGYPPLTADALNLRGQLELRSGDYEPAEASFRAAAQQAAIAGDIDGATAAWSGALRAVKGQARFDEAHAMASVVAAQLDHPDISDGERGAFHNELGAVFHAEGKYDRAREHYEQAVTLRERAFGPEHYRVGQALHNVAAAAARAGNYDDALRTLDRAIAIEERALGPDHPIIATSLVLRAMIFDVRGDNTSALDAARRALAIRERAHGENHHLVGSALELVGLELVGLGRLGEAARAYERALSIKSETLGDEHPELASTLLNLGELRLELYDLEAASPLLSRADGLVAKHHGTDSLMYSYVTLAQAQFARLEGQLSRAEELARDSVARRQSALKPKSMELANARHELGEVLLARGELEEADGVLRESLAASEGGAGAGHPQLVATLAAQARVALARQELSRARTLAERAATVAGDSLPERHPVVVASEVLLGRIALAEQDPARGIEHLERAAAAAREIDGWTLVRRPALELWLARAQWDKGQRDRAAQTWRAARAQLARSPAGRAIVARVEPMAPPALSGNSPR